MRAISAVCALCIVIGLTARADDSDHTLRFYMKQSDLVVSGTIVSEPEDLFTRRASSTGSASSN